MAKMPTPIFSLRQLAHHCQFSAAHRQVGRGNKPVTRIASWDSIVPAKPLAPVIDTIFYTFRALDASAAIAKTFANVPTAADFNLKAEG